jgi:NAD(P)-dependent dehydrogenase (short-subunit alcohol dehydrogenase family)
VDLTNASAIVTGGAGGFGSATVRRLAQMGARVVIADVSDERGEALAREVGAGSLYVPTDCMGEDAIAKAVKAAAGLGPLRAAVITHIGPGLARRPRALLSSAQTSCFRSSPFA